MSGYVPLISAVSVAVIGTLLAPWVLSLIKGKADLDVAEREQWRQERRERDEVRTAEMRGLKLENRTLREAQTDLERRHDETSRLLAALTARVEQQDATIIQQNGKLSERDTEIASLKQQVLDLRNELLEAYRRINDVRRAQEAGGVT